MGRTILPGSTTFIVTFSALIICSFQTDEFAAALYETILYVVDLVYIGNVSLNGSFEHSLLQRRVSRESFSLDLRFWKLLCDKFDSTVVNPYRHFD